MLNLLKKQIMKSTSTNFPGITTDDYVVCGYNYGTGEGEINKLYKVERFTGSGTMFLKGCEGCYSNNSRWRKATDKEIYYFISQGIQDITKHPKEEHYEIF